MGGNRGGQAVMASNGRQCACMGRSCVLMGVNAYNTDYNKLPVNDILIGDRANMQVCVVPHSSMYFVSCICMYAHAIRGCLRGRQLGINCCARLLWPTQSACAGSLGQHIDLHISPRKLAVVLRLLSQAAFVD